MRRVTLMLATALVAALLAGVAGAGGDAVPPAPGAAVMADQPGPAPLDETLLDALAHSPAGGLIDVAVSLTAPADDHMSGLLSGLAVWSRPFKRIPVAALRLPIARLTDLRNLGGVLGVYGQHEMRYFLADSAKLLNTERAWNQHGITGKGVTVAILDSGIDGTHPDFKDAVKANVKLAGVGDPIPVVVPVELPDTDTTIGHGTHVAGDVAGRGTASGGKFKGMAYGADLVGISAGDGLNLFTVLEGFEWILENQQKHGIRVVNNSWGSSFSPWDPYNPVNLATKVVHDAGIVVVFANGNDGDEMSMNPYAMPPWVVSVAAGSKKGAVTDFSSGGIEGDTVGFGFAKQDIAGETRRPLNMGIYHPAITATGDNVVAPRAAATFTSITGLLSDGGLSPTELPYYSTLSGTSMAAPEAAGVVALLLEAAPGLTPDQVRMILQITARSIPDVPFFKQGYGYTDASAAVELALSLAGKGPKQVDAVLSDKQAARDTQILSALPHPTRTYSWDDQTPTGVGRVSHKITVPEGTNRVKVVLNGGSLTIPAVGGPSVTSYNLSLLDAAGKEVATVDGSADSGTTALDVDLAKTEAKPAFGEWTFEIFVAGSLSLPSDVLLVTDFLPKRIMSSIVSVYGPGAGPVEAPCGAPAVFRPEGTVNYRLQDDDAQGVPYPADPTYTYVGQVPAGTLAVRSPERRLAGAFGPSPTGEPGPQFTAAPTDRPITIGGATVELYVRGPNDVVGGFGDGQLLDVGPDGVIVPFGGVAPGQGLNATTPAPAKTTLRFILPSGAYTLQPGHSLALTVTSSSASTAGNTLYYDSDAFPSQLQIVTGALAGGEACPLRQEVGVSAGR